MRVFSLILITFISGCGTDVPTSAAVVAPAVKRIFITSLTYSGNLGGLTGADAKCAIHATLAGLSGSWKAWLSDSSVNAIDRIVDVGPWYLVDKTTEIFSTKANLTTIPLALVNTDENGAAVSSFQVWTGTILGGTKNSVFCSNWTSSSIFDSGNAGYKTSIALWTDDNTSRGCGSAYSLYCLEQ